MADPVYAAHWPEATGWTIPFLKTFEKSTCNIDPISSISDIR
jgi:hypothetical protein